MRIGSWLLCFGDTLVFCFSFFHLNHWGVGCGNEVVVNEEGWEDDLGWQEQRLS